jgi:hypothetical protein
MCDCNYKERKKAPFFADVNMDLIYDGFFMAYINKLFSTLWRPLFTPSNVCTTKKVFIVSVAKLFLVSLIETDAIHDIQKNQTFFVLVPMTRHQRLKL